MDTKVDDQPTFLDKAKLTLAAAILVAGVAGFYVLSGTNVLFAWLSVLVALGIATVVVLQSVQGQELWKFIQSARVELRKVVWPTREETIQTTLAVLVFAVIMGTFFWGLDVLLLLLTRNLTGRVG